ncbi:MAG: tRNA (guanosine(37)-N1)-methyltransferase TrmD [Acidimicrobiaceae bacterium]|nr:tRNA (guanosine(37)-N1)-methyltransferase TrmD [Acidimicrobiaceae bacterium]
MRIDVLSLFPEAVSSYADTSVLGRARERGVWELFVHDFRDAASDVHRSVDDSPYGGGAGMVLTPEPIVRTIEETPGLRRPVIALTPSGEPFTHAVATRLSQLEGFTLLCGRYEGFDQRILDTVVDEELSLGDFVLAGGELAALCVIEAVVRLVPGGLGNDQSSVEESFGDGLLEYPHYTKPATWRGLEVPEILRSGNHAVIARWRRAQALALTLSRRPDLIERRGGLSGEEQEILDELGVLETPGENG